MSRISARAWTIVAGSALGVAAIVIVVSTEGLALHLIAFACAIAASNLIFQRGRGLITDMRETDTEDSERHNGPPPEISPARE